MAGDGDALGDPAALFGRHLAPSVAQLLAFLRRHLLEPLKLLAHVLLLLGRQALELLKALAQLLPLFGRHRAPLSETLLRARALFGTHGQPATAALGQRLLPVRRQASPFVLKAVQQTASW